MWRRDVKLVSGVVVVVDLSVTDGERFLSGEPLLLLLLLLVLLELLLLKDAIFDDKST